METWTALSVQKSILQPSRQKYNAASSGKPPIRRRQPQAPSSEFGAPRNRINRHAKSATSSPAFAQIPSRQHSCRAYTITHSKYHGHRRRRSSGSVKQRDITASYLHNLSFYLSGHCFSAASPEELDCRTYIGEKTKEATGFAYRRKYPGGIYLRSLYLFYLSVRSLPLDRICQIILFISA